MSILMLLSVILIFAVLLSSYRLFMGPTVYDRLLALNLVGVVVTVIFILVSVDTGMGHYMDIAVSFMVLDFVGTIAFARYLEGGDFQ